MTTGKKLALAGALVAGITAYMAYVGASASWQYYLTVDECAAKASTIGGDRIRVVGKIVRRSLQIPADRRHAAFSLEGTASPLPVTCAGPLPDNLREEVTVVVEGRLDVAGVLVGERVLTRCASKYKSQAAQIFPAAAGAELKGDS